MPGGAGRGAGHLNPHLSRPCSIREAGVVFLGEGTVVGSSLSLGAREIGVSSAGLPTRLPETRATPACSRRPAPRERAECRTGTVQTARGLVPARNAQGQRRQSSVTVAVLATAPFGVHSVSWGRRQALLPGSA